VALLCTVVLQMIFPVVLEQIVAFFSEPSFLGGPYGNGTGEDLVLWFLAPMFQLGLALFLGWRLHENLRRRSFAMEARTV